MSYVTKNIEDSTLDIDGQGRKVKVALARMGNEDRDGDIINKGAFNRTLKARGPEGSNEIWFLVDHMPSLKSALGKWKELYVEKDYLVGIAEYNDKKSLWRDVMWPAYEKGEINQHSIGFSIPDGQTETKDGIRYIKEIMLWEGSAVLWGANPDTPTMEVYKGFHIDETMSMKMDRLMSMLDEKDFDEVKQLLAIEFNQLKGIFTDSERSSTHPNLEVDDLWAYYLLNKFK